MNRRRFAALLACLCLTGCGADPAARPVTVSAPASAAQPEKGNFTTGLERQIQLENAQQTPGGVYYRELPPTADAPAPPPDGLTAQQAAEQASRLAAAMGLPVGDAVWELRYTAGAGDFQPEMWSCTAALPPFTTHVVEYAGNLNELLESMAGREYSWNAQLWLACRGTLLQYRCRRPGPFELEPHTIDEQAVHRRRAEAWRGGEEFKQAIRQGLESLGMGPLRRLLAPDEHCSEWRAELENGQLFIVNADMDSCMLDRLELLADPTGAHPG